MQPGLDCSGGKPYWQPSQVHWASGGDKLDQQHGETDEHEFARRLAIRFAKELNWTQTAIRRRATKLELPLKVVTVELVLKAKAK